ncbi:MAG: CHAP domain-containing protein, partial [Candidatus Gastranaerophilales bacterium]|nr:CHAP domain-containing protein [Candidatus Gastranaerophilales bacterium]
SLFLRKERNQFMLNIDSLASGFSAYLENLNSISTKDYSTTNSTYDIFKYPDEFKQYLKNETNNSGEILYMSVDEILNLEIENGKLVVPDEDEEEGLPAEDELQASETETDSQTATEESEVTEESEEISADETVSDETGETTADSETTDDNESLDVLSDLINQMLEMDEVKSVVDVDGNDEIDEEELENFINKINEYDDDEENLSLTDILSAMEDINNNEFSLSDTETEEDTDDVEDVDSTGAIDSADSNGTTGATGSSGGGSGVSGSSGNYSSGSSGTQEKTLDNMTEAELKSELKTANNDLSDKKSALEAIYNGTDSTIKKAQDDVDDAYNEYRNQLLEIDEGLAKEVDDLKKQQDKKQSEIDSKEIEISNQECAVSDAQTNYNNAVSTTKTLKASLSELENADTSDMDSSEKSAITSKISALKSKISESEKNEETTKTAWDEAKTKLEELNNSKTTLESEKSELDKQMSDLETKITENNPDIKNYLEKYNEAKENLETTKQNAVESAKKDIQESQDYVDEVNTAINNYDNKQITKEYALQDGSGEELTEFALGLEGKTASEMQQLMQSAGCQFDDCAWCADFVTYCLKQVYGDDIPGDFTSTCSNTAYCPTIESWAKSNGSYTQDSSQVQPGDLILYGSGVASHIGIVTSVNSDGTVNTIEGNTTNDSGGYGSGYVNAHSNVSNARSFVRLSALS